MSGFKTQARNWIRGHDTLVFYTVSNEYTWNHPRTPHDEKYIARFNKVDEQGRRYFGGRGKRRYLDDVVRKGKAIGDVWSDIMSFQQIPTSKEKVGYPTQKPLALLDRIINASSNEGDIVLDPFCGCATTCVSAENNNRKWIGIDVSAKAYDLVQERLEREVARPDALPTYRNEIHLQARPPERTDMGASVRDTSNVYIISHEKFEGFYKVGVSSNVQARLNQYQTSDPYRSYKLEFSHATHLYRETEAYVHQHFDNKYEWVKADLEEIKQVIVNYAGV